MSNKTGVSGITTTNPLSSHWVSLYRQGELDDSVLLLKWYNKAASAALPGHHVPLGDRDGGSKSRGCICKHCTAGKRWSQHVFCQGQEQLVLSPPPGAVFFLPLQSLGKTIWLRYAEFEMRCKFPNHARNVWDRAVALLPRVDQFWYKYSYMEVSEGQQQPSRRYLSFGFSRGYWCGLG